MSANKDQKRQKDNPQDKTNTENKTNAENKKKGFQPPPPKPFQQFSNPGKSKGGNPGQSFNAFHRRLGK